MFACPVCDDILPAGPNLTPVEIPTAADPRTDARALADHLLHGNHDPADLAEWIAWKTVGVRPAYYATRATPYPASAPAVPTPADVSAHPAYWISGPGQATAHHTRCPHGYRLTDSCPGCDAD